MEVPEFMEDEDIETPTRKASNIGVRNFIREMCWLIPQVYEAETGKNDIVVVEAYRDEFIMRNEEILSRTNNPGTKYTKCITLSNTRREPSPTRETNRPFDDTKGISPQYRKEERYDDTGGLYIVYGQKFDNIVRMDCWGRSNTEANELIDWLEIFLVKWEFWFTGRGIDRMFYYRSGTELSPTERSAMDSWRQPFKLRSLEWFVRDERLFYKSEAEISKIVARIKVEDGDIETYEIV